jgi:hypothetical protein
MNDRRFADGKHRFDIRENSVARIALPEQPSATFIQIDDSAYISTQTPGKMAVPLPHQAGAHYGNFI